MTVLILLDFLVGSTLSPTIPPHFGLFRNTTYALRMLRAGSEIFVTELLDGGNIILILPPPPALGWDVRCW